MSTDPALSATEKLLYLGRVAWSGVSLPVALRRLSVAAEHMWERAFCRGAVLVREGEPVASAYFLVRGRVRLWRRGVLLGEAGPGAIVGLDALLSRDELGIGVVAVTDVLALQVESDRLLGILGDHFPLVHEDIRAATRRLLALIRRLGPPDAASDLLFHPPANRPMNLVELLLLLRTPGGPFELSSIDALAELAGIATQAPFDAGHVFWREGDRSGRVCLLVEGSVECTSTGDSQSSRFLVGPGRPLGALESVAGEPRWYDAVGETAGVVLEHDVESLIDLFEDNVDVALDYLAWVSRTTLELIEASLGPGRELLEFFTTFSPPATPADWTVDGQASRALESEPCPIREEAMSRSRHSPTAPERYPCGFPESHTAWSPPEQQDRPVADDASRGSAEGRTPAMQQRPVEVRSASDRNAPTTILTDFVVFLDGRADNAGTVQWSAELAHEHGARLTGVFIEPTPTFSQPEMFARGSAIRDVIVEGEERLRRAEAERLASFEAVVRPHAIRWEWRHVHGLLAAELVVHARYSDLAIIARGDPSEHGHTPAGLLEALVLTSGRPIVVLPPRFAASGVRRILLGWNATPEATRAAAGALQLLVRAEAVEVLVVDPNGEAPGHGQEPGADIAQHLARHGARVEVRRLSSGGKDAGHVLLAEAAAFGADLVVIGAFGHSRLRERVFGGVTRTALLEAALPVLMCR